MSLFENTPTAEGAAKPTQNPAKIYETTSRDHLFLLLTLCYCVLVADIFFSSGRTALGHTVHVFAWYTLVLSSVGMGAMSRRENRILFLFNLFLALTLGLSSSPSFNSWNSLALLILLPVHTVALSGANLLPWHKPLMLWERLCLLMQGLFGRLGAAPAALTQAGKNRNPRRMTTVLLGGFVSILLLIILIPVLSSADALFAFATEGLRSFVRNHFFSGFLRFLFGLGLTPFVFGLLYSLRHPEPLKSPVKEKNLTWDATGFVMVLAALDALYLLFLAVQSTGLFGGVEYLAARGISYAEWARSGFFQMVGVTIVNLSVILIALSASLQKGKSWRVVRLLSAVLVVESLVLLTSAAWRMTLYVGAYGLSFKRVMTYWGMVAMALFFLTASRKIKKPDFSFCRAAFPLALALWLVINCIPVDYLVAKNQVDRYLNGQSSTISVEYLVSLSYDTLHQLDRLEGMTVCSGYGGEQNMDDLLSYRRERAVRDCSDWHTWSLSACLAALGS